jgi:predicted acetyltransferase
MAARSRSSRWPDLLLQPLTSSWIRKRIGGGNRLTFALVVPGREYLPSYVAALETGWSPNNVRGKAAADEQLLQIAEDPDGFLASLDDPEARGAPIPLPDGSLSRRLPSIIRWMWGEAFCGSIGLRWQHGTPVLPADVLGHVGFSVVPWKRGRGLATRALAAMLEEARQRGLPYVEITTTPDNAASRRVIEANRGLLVESFEKDAAYGGGEALRFRIDL